jgi:hypothetical protein
MIPKYKTIMKRSLALHLVNRGHELIAVEANKKNEHYMVYKFNQTPELIKDLLLFNAKTQ